MIHKYLWLNVIYITNNFVDDSLSHFWFGNVQKNHNHFIIPLLYFNSKHIL